MRIRRWKRRPGGPVSSMVSFGPGGTFDVSIDPAGFDGLEMQTDPSGGEWLSGTLWVSRNGHVSELVPPIFDSYAHIRAWPNGTHDEPRLETLLGILAGFTSTQDDAWFGLWEGYGGLERPPRPEQLFCAPPDPGRAMRRYFLFRGRLRDGTAMMPFPLGMAPDLMWPADRAWLVVSDTDFCHQKENGGSAHEAYVGGPDALITALDTAGEFEIRRVTPDTSHWADG